MALALTALVSTRALAGSFYYPTALDNPSWADCRELDLEFSTLIQEIHAENAACMQQKPKFGIGLACRLSQPYDVRETKMAWSQCDGTAMPHCALLANREKEVGLCRERAREHESDKGTIADSFRRANDYYETSKERLGQARSLLNDPEKFFSDKAAEAVTKQLFPDNWRNPRVVASDPKAEELFRYLHNQVKAGIAHPHSPFSGAVQQAAFDEILNHYRWTSNELANALRDLENFNIQQMDEALSAPTPVWMTEPEPTTPPSTKPARKVPKKPAKKAPKSEAAGCQLLTNPNQSRDLMRNNPSGWRDLVRRCR